MGVSTPPPGSVSWSRLVQGHRVATFSWLANSSSSSSRCRAAISPLSSSGAAGSWRTPPPRPPAPSLPPPIEALRELAPGTPVRIVTKGDIRTSVFRSLDEGRRPARVWLDGGGWLVDKINAVSRLPEFDRPERASRPSPGIAEQFAGLDRDWDARLACPPADLAIVGTRAWLLNDGLAYLTVEGRASAPPNVSFRSSCTLPAASITVTRSRSQPWFVHGAVYSCPSDQILADITWPVYREVVSRSIQSCSRSPTHPSG